MYKWIINNDALIIITTMHKCKESFYMAWLIMVSKMFDLSSLQKSLKCTCDEIKTELFFQKILLCNFRNSLRLRYLYSHILIFDNIVLAPIFLRKQKATQEVFVKSGEKAISYSKKNLDYFLWMHTHIKWYIIQNDRLWCQIYLTLSSLQVEMIFYQTQCVSLPSPQFVNYVVLWMINELK